MAAAKKDSPAGTAEESTSPMVLAVKTPKGRLIRLMTDMPMGVLVDIAAENDTSWAVVVGDPLFSGSGKIALAVYGAALDVAGEPMPERLTPKAVYDAFTSVPEDSPEYVDDGTPTEGAPATT